MKTQVTKENNETTSINEVYGSVQMQRKSTDRQIQNLMQKYKTTESLLDQEEMTEADNASYSLLYHHRAFLERIESELCLLAD